MSQKVKERWSKGRRRRRRRRNDEEIESVKAEKIQKRREWKEMTLGKRKPDRQTQGTRLLLVNQRSRPAVA